MLKLLRKCPLRPLRPAQRQLHRPLDLSILGRELKTLIKLHLNVGAEQTLDLDRTFGRQHMP